MKSASAVATTAMGLLLAGPSLAALGDHFPVDDSRPSPKAHRATVALAEELISTFAGNSSSTPGDGGPAIDAGFLAPSQAALDAKGNLYIADSGHNSVRRVDAATLTVSTVAGTGTPGYNGDGIQASTAELDLPESVAFDAAGNLYIADYGNRRVRKVDAVSGKISTVAGDGDSGEVPPGWPATQSVVNGPYALLWLSTWTQAVMRSRPPTRGRSPMLPRTLPRPST